MKTNLNTEKEFMIWYILFSPSYEFFPSDIFIDETSIAAGSVILKQKR